MFREFPLPLGTWDGLRYGMVALPEPSIKLLRSSSKYRDVKFNALIMSA